METHKLSFTCISFDSVDFLIPSKFIVSGIFLEIPRESKKIIYNRETLPHIFIGNLLEKEFLCKSNVANSIVMVMRMSDFDKDVSKSIVEYTDTAFPASGYLALSVNASISSRMFSLEDFRLMPSGIQQKMNFYGINAMLFPQGNRRQFLISPDLLLRKFFAGGLL